MKKVILLLLLLWALTVPAWGTELPREVRDALPAAAEDITEHMDDSASFSEGLSLLWERACGYLTDALRESIRAKKAASHEANADRLAEAALLDLAGANLTVELPAAVLDQNADHALQQLKDKLSRSRFSLELYCQANNTTPEQLRAGYRQDAARRMRAMLAVPAIARAENITVSNEEVDAEYARLARLHGNPEEEIRRVLARDAVAAALTNQKVQRFLLDHAAVTSIVEKE